MTAVTATKPRIALAPVSNSNLNIGSTSVKVSRLSTNMDFSLPQPKKIRLETNLLQRANTTIIEPKQLCPSDAAEKLKLRLKLAYYKLRTNQASVPISKLDKFMESKRVCSSSSKSSGPKSRPAVTSTPLPVRYVSSTPKVNRSFDSSLLASSTPLINSSNTSISIMEDRDVKNPVINSTRLTDFMKTKSFSEDTNTGLKLYSFKHGVAKAAKSISLPLKKSSAGTAPIIKITEIETREIIRLPEIKPTTSYKLPSISSLLNSKTSTPFRCSTTSTSHIRTQTKLQSPAKILVTPIKSRRSVSQNDMLFSSPTKMLSTPSSMGAARSLLQLALH